MEKILTNSTFKTVTCFKCENCGAEWDSDPY